MKYAISIIKNIMEFTQRKYKHTDISCLGNIIIPKKATIREDIKAKRQNYLEIEAVKAIVGVVFILADSMCDACNSLLS